MTCQTNFNLYLNSNNVLELQSLTNTVTQETVTDATVQGLLTDPFGGNPDGQIWPVLMPHVADGLYRATLENTLVIKPGRIYRVTIEATDNTGEKRTFIDYATAVQ